MTARPKILLIEDDPTMQATFKEYLEPTYDVTTSETAQHAIDILKKEHFKVILVDMGLPDASGLTIIETALENHKKTPVLALTGDKTSETVHKAIKAGVDDYLVKPVSQPQLLSRIEKAVLKHALHS